MVRTETEVERLVRENQKLVHYEVNRYLQRYFVGTMERDDLISAYHRRLTHPDDSIRLPAARAWSVFEGETITLLPDPGLSAAHASARFALAFARIENHYFVHGGWLDEGQLIRDAGKLAGIPGVIVQGRYDMACPPVTAFDLHTAWPGSKLIIVEDAGHAYSEPGILHQLILVTDRFGSAGL